VDLRYEIISRLGVDLINDIGEAIRAGKSFAVDQDYADLLENYCCVFKEVSSIWYYPFLNFATLFYDGMEYPVRQCIWPDMKARYP
jgi:hypothetical protein